MNAVLALEDGTWFGGTSVGAAGETSGFSARLDAVTTTGS